MRKIGFTFLGLGFAWIVADCFLIYTARQYTLWMHYVQSIPAEGLGKNEISRILSENNLTLSSAHRLILIPAAVMLVGGFFAAASKQNQK